MVDDSDNLLILVQVYSNDRLNDLVIVISPRFLGPQIGGWRTCLFLVQETRGIHLTLKIDQSIGAICGGHDPSRYILRLYK